MRKSVKIVSVLSTCVVLALALLLVGCGSSSSTGTSKASSTASTAQASNEFKTNGPKAISPKASEVNSADADGVLTVGFDQEFPPYGYVGNDGTFAGVDLELAAEVENGIYLTGSVANAVRQVAESEGTILDKTKLLMILITALSLIGSALGISNLVTASVMERAQEIGLLKAIGAKDRSITGVVMTEILITALVGFAVGYFMGFGFAQLIGQSVFGSAIEMNTRVIPIVAALIALVTIAGSLPAIRMVLRLRPAEVLHGGH